MKTEPLHVERGFDADESCVTVCASEAPHNVNDHGSTTPEGLLTALAGTAAITGSNNIYLGGEPLVILGPEHAATIAFTGWSKAARGLLPPSAEVVDQRQARIDL